MAYPPVTIKGNTTDKKKIVDRLHDLCLAHEELTQTEVLDMLMASYAERKDVPENLDELTQKASLYEFEKHKREIQSEVNGKIHYLLGIGLEDSILPAFESLPDLSHVSRLKNA